MGAGHNSNERAKTTTSDPGNNSVVDPDLDAVVTAWPTLPDAVRADIVAMVQATGCKE